MRARAGVFDVSHMGQLEVSGDGSKAFLQRVLSNDLDRLRTRQAQYTLLTNDAGRHRRRPDRLPPRHRPLAARGQRLATSRRTSRTCRRRIPAAGVELVDRSGDYGMVALQGPAAIEVLETLWDRGQPAARRPRRVRGHGGQGRRHQVPHRAHRLHRRARRGADPLLGRHRAALRQAAAAAASTAWCRAASARGTPCGCEVCYPLHGNDISPETNAIEAGLGWVCALDKDFTGADVLRRVKAEGPKRRLVALRMLDRAIPRAGPSAAPRGRADRRGHERHAVAEPRPRYRPRLSSRATSPRPGASCRSTSAGASATPRWRRSRSTGRRSEHGGRGELPRGPPLSPGARLGADRRGRGRLRDHLVRPGRARGGRVLRAARGVGPRRRPMRRTASWSP